jgi:hypothetical protein
MKLDVMGHLVRSMNASAGQLGCMLGPVLAPAIDLSERLVVRVAKPRS